jgi:restriction system protein
MNMPIPDYQTLMLPLLKIAGDGKVHTKRDALSVLAEQFTLTEDERKELLPSGNQAVFDNRVGWARTYLKKAVLIEYVQRGQFQITERGKSVLAKNPPRIDVPYLRQFPEFLEFQKKPSHTTTVQEQVEGLEAVETPEELVASGYLKLRQQVEYELLSRVKDCPPEFFERLVVKLLTTIGYGGSLADAGKALGKSGDGGVDGVIKEDKLGLDQIYIQAKRWDGTTVGRPEIQKFVGALHGKRARKGIFITTSTFSKDAQEYANSVETKVILIDGSRLVELMFEYGVGVSTVNNYVVKRIDSDFFEDEVGFDVAPDAATK